MRTSIICFLFMCFLFPNFSQAQTKSINKFYKKYKKKKNTVNFTIPGWLIDIGAGIGKLAVDEPEEKAALKLAKKIQKVRILVIEEGNPTQKKDRVKLIRNLQVKDTFDPLLQVRDGEMNVQIMVREKKEKLKNFFILVNEPDEFVMLSLKTKLKMKDINKLINLLNEDLDMDMDILPPATRQDEELIKA